MRHAREQQQSKESEAYTLTDDTCKEFVNPKIVERSRMKNSPNIVLSASDNHGRQ